MTKNEKYELIKNIINDSNKDENIKQELIDYLEEINKLYIEIDNKQLTRKEIQIAIALYNAKQELKRKKVIVETVVTEEGRIYKKPDYVENVDDYVFTINPDGSLCTTKKGEEKVNLVKKIQKKLKR